jgi:hypothetical protein
MHSITPMLQLSPSCFQVKRTNATTSTQTSTSFVVNCNPQSQNKSQIQIKMSQIATAVIPEAAAVVIGTENANPNAESISVLKAKDVEHVVCTENLRSESSTPVKDNVEAQLVATSQPSGDCLIIKF